MRQVNMDKRLEAQKNEFDAVAALAKAFRDLPAVMDDDYPAARWGYEGKVRAVIHAFAVNGRCML